MGMTSGGRRWLVSVGDSHTACGEPVSERPSFRVVGCREGGSSGGGGPTRLFNAV